MQSTSGHEMESKGAGKTFMLFRAQSTPGLKEGTKEGREDIYTQSKMNQIAHRDPVNFRAQGGDQKGIQGGQFFTE